MQIFSEYSMTFLKMKRGKLKTLHTNVLKLILKEWQHQKAGRRSSKWKTPDTNNRPSLEEAMSWMESVLEGILELLGGKKPTLWYLP